MPTDLTIRRATTDDVEAIQGVARRSWREAYEGVIDDAITEQLLEEGYSREMLEAAVDSPDVELFVAERDGSIVGYGSAEAPAEGDVGQASFYVDPDCWGEGIGTTLLERVQEHLVAQGATAMRDTVLADNEVGNAFYDEHFERTDETTVELAGETFDAYVYSGDL